MRTTTRGLGHARRRKGPERPQPARRATVVPQDLRNATLVRPIGHEDVRLVGMVVVAVAAPDELLPVRLAKTNRCGDQRLS